MQYESRILAIKRASIAKAAELESLIRNKDAMKNITYLYRPEKTGLLV